MSTKGTAQDNDGWGQNPMRDVIKNGLLTAYQKQMLQNIYAAKANPPQVIHHVICNSPKDYPHTRAFDEAINVFSKIWKQHSVKKDLVFGAHIPNFDGKNYPKEAIIFNTEVPGSPWFTDGYKEILKSHEVWDYSPQNVCELYEQLGIEAKLCPIGYHGTLETMTGFSAPKDIDVLFYGSMTPRREKIWEQVNKLGLRTKHIFNIYGPIRNAYIMRSRAVLNMHAYDNSPREDFRLALLWANQVPVFDESVEGENLIESIVNWRLSYKPGEWYGKFKKQLQADAVAKCL